MRTYTTGQIIAHSGASPRQIRHWANRGWLSEELPGSGHGRTWTERDYKLSAFMMRLVTAGFTPEKAHPIAALVVDAKDVQKGVRIRIGKEMWIIVKGIES